MDAFLACARRFSALKLRVVQQIVWTWLLTIPTTMALAFGLVWLLQWWGWIG